MKSTQNRPTKTPWVTLTFHQSTLWAAAPAGIYKVLGVFKKDAKIKSGWWLNHPI